MASQKIFSPDLVEKYQSALMTLSALNQKESQQIIAILKVQPLVNGIHLAEQMGLHYASVHHHLEALYAAKLLSVKEEADQASFSLNHARLAQISRIVRRLTQ